MNFFNKKAGFSEAFDLKKRHNLILTEPREKLLSPFGKRKLKVGVVY